MSDIKVSVIIPCYNAEAFVAQSLDSVLNQTLKEIEIICVNDGSQDQTLAVLRDYEARHDNVRVIDKPNGGPSSARNAGLAVARGRYVQFLDSDDYLDGAALEQLCQAMEEQQYDILFFDGSVIYEDESLHERFRDYDALYTSKTVVEGVLSGQEMYLALRKGGSYRVQPCMQMLRLSHLKEHGITFKESLQYYEDNLFTMAALLSAQRAGQMAKPFYWRRLHANSIVTGKKDFRHVRSYITCFIEMTAFLANGQYSDEVIRSAQVTLKSLFQSAQKAYASLTPTERQQALRSHADSQWISLLLGLDEAPANPQRLEALGESWGKLPFTPERPLVSVIMPVTRVGSAMHETVRCLQAQSLQNFEVCFVTCGESDEAVGIARACAAKDRRFRVLRQKGATAGAARNYGLTQARGEFVTFLEAQDRFEPDMLLLAYEQAKVFNAQVLVCDADDAAGTIPEASGLYRARPQRQYVFKAENVKDFVFDMPRHWTKFYRRAYLLEKEFRFQELPSGDGSGLALSTVAAATILVLLPVTLVHHRPEPTGYAMSVEELYPLDAFEALMEVKRQLSLRGLEEGFGKLLAARGTEALLRELGTLRTKESFQALYARLHDGGLKELGFPMLTAEDLPAGLHDHAAMIAAQPYEAYAREQCWLTVPEAQGPRQLQDELRAIRGSLSYRVGRALTLLPRKLGKGE